MDACYKAANESLCRDLAPRNPNFKKIYDSDDGLPQRQYLWWQVAEYGFDSFMIRARAPQLT